MTENELLSYIQEISQRTGFLGTGDDAAVLPMHSAHGTNWIVSTDQFIEGTHFTWDQMTPEEIGYKGVVQALSDLAAMAAAPKALLSSLAWPPEALEKVKGVYKGIESACLEYGVPLIGGDISRSAFGTYMDFTVMGQSSQPISQGGAQAGDLLAVSGPLGSAAAGFRALRDKPVSSLTPEVPQEFITAFKKPRAQIERALALGPLRVLTSLTDISDGLATCLQRMSLKSKCGFVVDLKEIPHSKNLKILCTERHWNLKDFLLGGGEDYQLLMTLPPGTDSQVLLDHGLTVIGHAVNGANSYIEDGTNHPLPEVGWDPFHL